MRSSIFDAGQPLTSFVSVLASQACGFTPLSLQVSISEATIAQLAPPSSLPAKSAFFRFNAIGRMLRSTVLESISMRPVAEEARQVHSRNWGLSQRFVMSQALMTTKQ